MTTPFNILLIGNGGREHALAWKIRQSPLCQTLYTANGSDGMAAIAECIPLNIADHQTIIAFCQQHTITLVVVGPEAPLVDGLADSLRDAGIAVFGPGRAAAQLEGSKGFMKALCSTMNIPTAAYACFTDIEEATAYINSHALPVVVKADGLAAGKGVVVAETHAEAIAAARHALQQNGDSIVVEAFLQGEEVSFFALTDGENVIPLTTAQDHKRALDGDCGANTGGMGAYAPARLDSPHLTETVIRTIITPTLEGLRQQGIRYQGVLYAGLMVDGDNVQLLEYNVRFGDPECEVLMLLLTSDIVPYLLACANSTLDTLSAPTWRKGTALCVVYATTGYPAAYDKGFIIHGIEAAAAVPDTEVFHAGTRFDGKNWRSHGGRVLVISSYGRDGIDARTRAYQAIQQIDWPEGFYRRDIGWRLLPKAA